MEVAEIERRLDEALKLRIPVFDPDEHPGKKIAALEDHILQVAYIRAELEEALHWTMEAGKVLRRKWDRIEGYEVSLRGSRPTKEQVDAAKATIDQETWEGLEQMRFLARSLERQISRLGGSDYDTASRVYTFINGR